MPKRTNLIQMQRCDALCPRCRYDRRCTSQPHKKRIFHQCRRHRWRGNVILPLRFAGEIGLRRIPIPNTRRIELELPEGLLTKLRNKAVNTGKSFQEVILSILEKAS